MSTEAVFTAAGSAPAGPTEAVPTEAVFTAAGSAPAVLAEAGPTEAETWPAKARSTKESVYRTLLFSFNCEATSQLTRPLLLDLLS